MSSTSRTVHTWTLKSSFVKGLSFCALLACASLPASCQRQARSSTRVAASPAAAPVQTATPGADEGRARAEQETVNQRRRVSTTFRPSMWTLSSPSPPRRISTSAFGSPFRRAATRAATNHFSGQSGQ